MSSNCPLGAYLEFIMENYIEKGTNEPSALNALKWPPADYILFQPNAEVEVIR